MPDILQAAQTSTDTSVSPPNAPQSPVDDAPVNQGKQTASEEVPSIDMTTPPAASQASNPLSGMLSSSAPYTSEPVTSPPPSTPVVPTPTGAVEPPPPPPQEAPVIVPPPAKPKSAKRGLVIAVILILLATIPVGVYFLSQRQAVTQQPSKASVCCNGGTCNNGWSFGEDRNFGGGSCDDRKRLACDGSQGTGGSGGIRSGGDPCSGGGPPSGQQCPPGDQGQGGETCDLVPDKCDVAGGCNPACCDPARTPAGKVCDVPNGYCRSGKSSRDVGTGYHLTCANNQCVNQLCAPGVASCANDCSSHSQCQGTTGTTAPPPTSSLCHYVNTGTSVSVANCAGYTFRKLVYQCNGPLSRSSTARCEDKGIHPGFESILEDQTGATNVVLGSVPNCKSKQADLIVVGRPAGDTICPAGNPSCSDTLPGTPVVANYVKADGSQVGCAATPVVTQPPTTGACPYNSTQARIQTSETDPWGEAKTVSLNQSVNLGGFHNGTGFFAGDTTPGHNNYTPNVNNVDFIITKPDGTSQTITPQGAVSKSTFAPTAAGTYSITGKTKKSTGGYFDGVACTNTVTLTASAPAPQCTAFHIYDASGADITAAVANRSRPLVLGETITLGSPKGNASKAHFRILNKSDWTETTTVVGSEFRLTTQVPSTLSGDATGKFEVEVWVNDHWE